MVGQNSLELLVEHLSSGPFQPHHFRGWRVRPIDGGSNNLIYRVTNASADLAVKFTLRDARGRAEREFLALTALQQRGLRLAPTPIWLEPDRYPHPVVVQTWREGEVMTTPPRTDAAWEQLLQLYTAVHRVTPQMTELPIQTGVFAATSQAEARELVFGQADLIPKRARPAELEALLKSLESVSASDAEAERVLCHIDANVGNFINCAGELYAVDWEGSGWSDPAFELANLITHPAYLDVPWSRWEWVLSTYARLSQNKAIPERVGAYYPYLLVFWVARFARTLYEVPRGLDQRLVNRPDNWQADVTKKYQHYLALAQSLLQL